MGHPVQKNYIQYLEYYIFTYMCYMVFAKINFMKKVYFRRRAGGISREAFRLLENYNYTKNFMLQHVLEWLYFYCSGNYLYLKRHAYACLCGEGSDCKTAFNKLKMRSREALIIHFS